MTLESMIMKSMRMKTKTNLIIIILILSSLFDSLRDSTLFLLPWWPWHVIKWLAFFPALTYLWIGLKGWRLRVTIASACFLTWQLSYYFILWLTN